MAPWKSASRSIIAAADSSHGGRGARRARYTFQRDPGEDGRRSIPPERLLHALLLQMFYTIRSERMLMEQLEYNLLFRWFVGLTANEPVWHPTVFSKNRDRLLEGAVAGSSSR
jgi:transposase